MWRVLSTRRITAASHAVMWRRLPLQARFINFPSPSELFTSPGGLMALLYGRTASKPHTVQHIDDACKTQRGRRGRPIIRSSRRANTPSRPSTENPAGAGISYGNGEERGGDGGGGGAERSTFGFATFLQHKETIAVAAVIFLLSAFWSLASAQSGAVSQRIKDLFLTTLEVRSSQEDFAMIVDWMSRQPHGQRSRNITLKPITVLDEHPHQMWGNNEVPSHVHDDTNFAPGYGSHFFIFESTWMWITRREDQSKQKGMSSHTVDRENDVLTITMLTRRRETVERFLSAVHESWRTHVHNKVRIYQSCGYGSRWQLLTERGRRPLSTLYLPQTIKEVVEEARTFLTLKDTYRALGIPWRRGYLLEGAPGTGKSSFVMALASELNLPVHLLSLQTEDMNDDVLLSVVSSLPCRSILLIEDFENAIKRKPGGAAGDMVGSDTLDTEVGGGKTAGVSLSALLNALDGVSSSEGRLLLITTNDASRIPFPEALLRPGRVDRRVFFKPLQPKELMEMKQNFMEALRHSPDISPALRKSIKESQVDSSSSVETSVLTPAAYQEALLDMVYKASSTGRTI